MQHVDIYCDTIGTHLLQIFSGLYLLEKKGLIKLHFKLGLPITKSRPNRQFFFLRMHQTENANSGSFLFDMQDSPELGLPEAIDKVDFYVKRSLEPESFNGLNEQQKKKLIPFGFNYQVVSFSKSFFCKMFGYEFLSRPYSPLGKKHNFHVHNLKDIVDVLFLNKKNGLLNEKDLSPGPSAAHTGKILFQCRLWDVEGIADKNKEDTHQVNQSRIALIRGLKQEFGERFIGGLQNTAYARQEAPELISNLPSGRRDYIQLVRDSALVISTSGLLKSNGWKLGEYVALGKCILSEPIGTQLPGDFAVDKNYYAFREMTDCLSKIHTLLGDHEEIKSCEMANKEFYEKYLQPAQLMAHFIAKAQRGGREV